MLRSDIRYALFRCKTGNPTPDQKLVLAKYLPAVKKLKLEVHDFSDTWDISTTEPFDSILVGGAVIMLQELRDESVVTEDGKPKDPLAAKIASDIDAKKSVLSASVEAKIASLPKASASSFFKKK